MVDRIAEIRTGLSRWDKHRAISATQRRAIAAAARAYVDLLDSDALIIRRDDDGKWPEWALDALASIQKPMQDEFGNWPRWWPGTIALLDALASSQGVEPQ